MNFILAVKQNAGSQRDELIAERVQILKRLAQIGADLIVLEIYELVATAENGAEAKSDVGRQGA
ncbi:MAG: hypothetical protein ABSG25_09980 [Bryobacteraceae bacterium]